MTAAQLKASILDQAIRGHLTAKWREERRGKGGETAVELLARITAVRNAASPKKGRAKTPASPQAVGEDEMPFELPDGWAWCRLGDVLDLLSGRDLEPSAYEDAPGVMLSNGPAVSPRTGMIPYLTGASNIIANDVVVNRWTSRPVVIAKPGDLLITCKGTVGSMAVLTGQEVHIARQIMAIRSSQLNIEYIRIVVALAVPELQKDAKSMIPGIGRDDMLSLKIPLPPLSEQREIVRCVEELLPLVEKYGAAYERRRKLVADLPAQLRKSILQHAIEGQLVPQDPNDEPAFELLARITAARNAASPKKGRTKTPASPQPVGEDEQWVDIPDNWSWCHLGDVLVDTGAGKSPQCLDRARQVGEWGVIKTTAIQDGCFVAEENKLLPDGFPIQEPYIIHKGDLLITRAGPQNRTGVACVVTTEVNNLILSDKTVRLEYLNGFVEPEYLVLVFRSSPMRAVMLGSASGMAESQVNISQGKMKSFPIPLPPLAEQKRIVAKVEELLAAVERLSAER